jgi:ArsR family transcriptional regulator
LRRAIDTITEQEGFIMATKKAATKTLRRKAENASAPPLNYDPVIVKKVQAQMLEENHLSAVSAFFKVLGDETRMRIINALSHGELCVSDIAAALEMTQSAVSHQLKLLRMAHQVKARREGKSIYYSLDDQHVIDILDEALIHVRHKMNEAE